MSGGSRHGPRAAPLLVLGVVVAAALWLGFVPIVNALYALRGSPPVAVDVGLLAGVSLVANAIVLAALVTAHARGPRER